MYYYVYTHTNIIDNTIFYVGIGSSTNKNEYFRAYSKNRKNQKEWTNYTLFNNYSVEIIAVYDNKEDACSKEIELISKYGRKMFNEGLLLNKAPGGHKWKDTIKIYQYNLTGEFIAEWTSPKEAAHVLKLNYTNIYKSCKGPYRAGQFQFKTFKKQIIDAWINKSSKEVFLFSKTAEFINSYNSIEETARQLNTTANHVREGLNGKRITVKNYILSHNRNYCKVKRIIEQYSLDGILLNKFSSLTDVKKKLNLNSHNSIDNAIKGIIQKTAYGYLWKEILNTKVYVN
jgi:hypothetical protein